MMRFTKSLSGFLVNYEIEIIAEASDFAKDQKYLAGELNEILNCKARFIEMEEAEQKLEIIIYKVYDLSFSEVKIIDPEIEKIIAKKDYDNFNI